MKKMLMSRAGRMWAVMALLAMLMGACSNSPEVEAELKVMYKKVPADASVVVSGNLSKIVEQTGGKVNDGKIEPADDSVLESLSTDKKIKGLLGNVKNFTDGIEAGAFVAFIRASQPYAIFKVRDLAELKASIDQEAKGEWTKSGKIEYKPGYYLSDNGEYLWLASGMDMEVFEEWQNLSEVGSFLGNEYAPQMAASKEAVNMWASLDGLYSSLSFAEQAQARMAVSMLFEQPKYITGHANFEKKGCKAECMLTTSDYKPAKCVIDLSKIDPAVVSGLGGNANMIVAVNVSQKLVGQIKDLGKSMGGALPAEIWSLISPLDGTSALAAADFDRFGEGYKAVVTTNGEEDAALGKFLGSFGNVNIQGKTLGVSKGNYGNGRIALAEAAKEMKDAWLGIAAASETDGGNAVGYILLEPADGTLRLVLLSKLQ